MSSKPSSVIVTGGASGIGLAITKYFAAKGATIAVLDISHSALEVVSALQTEFPSANISLERCDVSSWQQQADAFAKVYREHGSIDIVMANAGITEISRLIPKEVEDEPSEPNLTTLNVNLVGVIYSVKLAVHYMRKKESVNDSSSLSSPATSSNGLIICTASNAGLYPFPVAPVYGTSKHGVIGLVRSLARPLERHRIQINGLAPAVLQTNIAGDKALFSSMILTPMSTLTKAVSIFVEAEATAAGSDHARFITGEVAEVHGDTVTMSRPQEYVDEDSRANLETFWRLGYA